MKTYSVYVKETDQDFLEAAVLVKEKFYFSAFLLPFVWALLNRVWWFAALALLLNAIMALIAQDSSLGAEMKIIPEICFMLFAGFEAADFKSKSLIKKGYSLRDVVIADDEEQARYKFLARELPAKHKAA